MDNEIFSVVARRDNSYEVEGLGKKFIYLEIIDPYSCARDIIIYAQSGATIEESHRKKIILAVEQFVEGLSKK